VAKTKTSYSTRENSHGPRAGVPRGKKKEKIADSIGGEPVLFLACQNFGSHKGRGRGMPSIKGFLPKRGKSKPGLIMAAGKNQALPRPGEGTMTRRKKMSACSTKGGGGDSFSPNEANQPILYPGEKKKKYRNKKKSPLCRTSP